MIRVGFIPAVSRSWLGGIHYYQGLLSAIAALPDRRIEPVLVSSAAEPIERALDCAGFEVVHTRLLDRHRLPPLLQQVLHHARRLDGRLEALLLRLGIRVVSHTNRGWDWHRVRSMGWIYDFQHLHLPQIFPDEHRRIRDLEFRSIARGCDRVILSSEAARTDFEAFQPDAAHKARVLRFVPDVDVAGAGTPRAELERRYGFSGRYFLLPNQFWVHKNHAVVIDALAELRASGEEALVLATGHGDDPRAPGHFQSLVERARRLGVSDAFRTLGVIPHADVLSLMRHADAMINPSLFEGWNTAVEEAKALARPVVLSSIAPHLEQAPESALYFDPHDARELAGRMRTVLARGAASTAMDPGAAAAAHARARADYARRFENLVLDVAGAG